MANVTIKDVAREARVSIATVSRVLNDHESISAEARTRVLAAAKALGYVPNSVARSLVKRSTQTLGFVISDITNPFFPAMTRGVEDCASAAGYTVILCNTDRRPEKEAEAAATLMAKQVDGVIFASARAGNRYVSEMVEAMPVVTVEPVLNHPRIGHIAFDNVEAARLATAHLLALGHRRIGLLGNDLATLGGLDRLKGYQLELSRHGIPVDRDLIREGHFDWESGYRGARELLALPDPPTAMQACSDMAALGALEALHEAGLEVPKDGSVIGFDDIPLARHLRPKLSTVRQPAYDMGTTAVQLILQMLQNPAASTSAPVRLFRPELIARDSTGPAPPRGS